MPYIEQDLRRKLDTLIFSETTDIIVSLSSLTNGSDSNILVALSNKLHNNFIQLKKHVFSALEITDPTDVKYFGCVNYAATRIIQGTLSSLYAIGLLPKKFSYSSYLAILTALIRTSQDTQNSFIGAIWFDVILEFKWRMNRAYEDVKILENGDCFDGEYVNNFNVVTYQKIKQEEKLK